MRQPVRMFRVPCSQDRNQSSFGLGRTRAGYPTSQGSVGLDHKSILVVLGKFCGCRLTYQIGSKHSLSNTTFTALQSPSASFSTDLHGVQVYWLSFLAFPLSPTTVQFPDCLNTLIPILCHYPSTYLRYGRAVHNEGVPGAVWQGSIKSFSCSFTF